MDKKERTQRVVFLDTNVYLSCFFEEDDLSLEVLEHILIEMDAGRVLLILPEIVKAEVDKGISDKLDELLECVEKFREYKHNNTKPSKSISDAASLSVADKRTEIQSLLRRLNDHVYMIRVDITDQLILRGLRRSLVCRPPARKTKKTQFMTDQDAVIFESILEGLGREPLMSMSVRLLLCTHDPDYFSDTKKAELQPEIISDLNVHCESSVGYSNPVEMLQKELGVERPEQAKAEIDRAASVAPQLVRMSEVIPGIIKGSSQYLYWLSTSGKRYVIPNEETFNTWFSGVGIQLVIQLLSDETLATIPIGGNITYRPGTRLLKLKTDSKIYAVANERTLRWIQSHEVGEAIFGDDWLSLVDEIPDMFFVNYTIGEPISSAEDYDPVDEKSRSRLP